MTRRGNTVGQGGGRLGAGWISGGYRRPQALRWVPIVLLIIVAGTGICLLAPSGASGAANENGGSQKADAGCPQVPPTPHFTIAYGIARVGGQDAPEGAVVQALSPRGIIAGCIRVTTAGHYGAMFVFGEDTTARPPIAGMRPGEPVAFRLGGDAAAVSPALVWTSDQQYHEAALSAGPAEVCYSLSTSASPAAGGSVDAGTEPNCTGDLTKYAAGTQVQLTANPSQGYAFDQWSGGASGSDNPTTVTMDQDRSVTANFSQQCYTLSIGASPAAGGSVEVNVAPNCSGDPSKYAAGTQVQLTANPTQSYSFALWTGDASGNSQPHHRHHGPGPLGHGQFQPAVLHPEHRRQPRRSGSVEAMSRPIAAATRPSTPPGPRSSSRPVPDQGYAFDQWSGGASGSNNPTTVTMDQDRSVTANFSQQCYTLSTIASPTAGGSVEVNVAPNCSGDPSKYAAGTQVQLTASPTRGYSFWLCGAAMPAAAATPPPSPWTRTARSRPIFSSATP